MQRCVETTDGARWRERSAAVKMLLDKAHLWPCLLHGNNLWNQSRGYEGIMEGRRGGKTWLKKMRTGTSAIHNSQYNNRALDPRHSSNSFHITISCSQNNFVLETFLYGMQDSKEGIRRLRCTPRICEIFWLEWCYSPSCDLFKSKMIWCKRIINLPPCWCIAESKAAYIRVEMQLSMIALDFWDRLYQRQFLTIGIKKRTRRWFSVWLLRPQPT